MKTIRPFLAAVAGLALFFAGATALAQTQQAEIVLVDDSRYDEGGRVTLIVELRNLSAELDLSQVTVTADGQPVSDLTVETTETGRVPVGIVLVMDSSGSMAGAPLAAAKDAAKQFVAQKAPEDYVALVTFNDTAQVLASFTRSGNEITNRIDSIEATGETALYDGVMQGVNLYQGAAAALKRNMIVLGDGDDTVSASAPEDVLAALSGTPENPMRAFSVALSSPDFDPSFLEQVATSTDGLFLSTPDPAQLSELYGQIQRELSNTLVIRFASPVNANQEVLFEVSYGSLVASRIEEVPGYVPPTTAAPATTTTFTRAATQVISSEAALPIGTLLLLAVLAAGLTIALFIFILFGAKGDDEGTTFTKRLQAYGRRGAGEEVRGNFFSRIPLLRRFTERAEEEVRRRGLLTAVNSALEQANIPLGPGEAIAAALGLAALIGAITGIVQGSTVFGLITFGVMVFVVAALVQFVGRREKRRFEDQLPDTLTLLSTSLRAGYSLLQAVEAVAAEAPQPTSREFGRAIAESRLGRAVVQAMQGITERMGSEDFRWAVMAIEIQREVGGNLAEVLQTVADTMLARNRLRREIKALTAEGRISAIVLGLLPFGMALFLWTTNRDYLLPLYTTTGGIIALIVGLLLMVAGGLWLRKIVNIEV